MIAHLSSAALTSEASNWAMLLMLGFSGVGYAAFSIAERFGRRTAAEWWKGKLNP
jgi:hypothetical protein